jgi:cell shape-determining protein MreD
MFLLLPLLIIAILFEGTITTLPLVLICLLCLTIRKRDGSIFPIAFFAGLLVDVLRIQSLGGSSIFFLVFVLLILLYQRKYEINSYPFVAVSSFLGSWIFLALFGYSGSFGQALVSAGIGLLLFRVSSKFKIKS